MQRILEKVKFIRKSAVELDVSKKKFYDKLFDVVEERDVNVFSEQFEIFSSSNKPYFGYVKYGSFK